VESIKFIAHNFNKEFWIGLQLLEATILIKNEIMIKNEIKYVFFRKLVIVQKVFYFQ